MLGDFDGEKLKGLMFINVKISPAVLPCGCATFPISNVQRRAGPPKQDSLTTVKN